MAPHPYASITPHRLDPAPPESLVTEFTALPAAIRASVAFVVLAGVALLVSALVQAQIDRPAVVGLLTGLAAVALLVTVESRRSAAGATSAAWHAVAFGALLLEGPPIAMLLAAAGGCALHLPGTRRTPRSHAVFAAAGSILTVQAAALAARAFGGGTLPLPSLASSETAVAAAAVVYFVVHAGFTIAGHAMWHGSHVSWRWSEEVLWEALSYGIGSGVAIGAVLLHGGPGVWLMPLLVAPLYVAYRVRKAHADRLAAADHQVESASALHLKTIEALALAIDAKDHAATSHVRRVQAYAVGLAQSLGLPAGEVRCVGIAALLHDIGKLAVPEYILSKQGPLTPEEVHRIQVHPQIGAEIIAHVPFPYPVAPLILGHHERWDGKGYPERLAGEAIPLGARILAVVECFDAIRSGRPGLKAGSYDRAVETLRAEAGTSFDPRLVERFIEDLPVLDARVSGLQAPARRLSFSAHADDDEKPATVADPPARSVFNDIAVANREISALYDIAQSMGTGLGIADTMSLITSKLINIVPFSSCALFLHDTATDRLRCAFASGVEADLVRQLALPVGHGSIGWVARNLRPLVNARPADDFEAQGLQPPALLASTLVCPLVFNARLIGAIAVYDVPPGRFTDDHRRLLDRVCEQAAGVVHNAVVFEDTRRDSLTDSLTGLPNTRSMLEHMSRELARAERLGGRVSLLLLDLDDFKAINDRHGHHCGDQALRAVAAALTAATRPYDLCVRYAGDEFVVVLPGCGPDEADAKRLELQASIEAIRLSTPAGPSVGLGASIGCASFPEDGGTYELLLTAADRRMYTDKGQRKLQPSAAGEPPQVEAALAATSPGDPASAKIEARPTVDRMH